MEIVATHSHLNGLEFLSVRQPALWEETQSVLRSIRFEACTVQGVGEMESAGLPVFSITGLNAIVEKGFSDRLWKKVANDRSGLIKNRVAIESQLGKPASFAYDLFVKHLAFYIGDKIDVGIEILPMKALQKEMSSGVAYYEGEIYNVIRHGRGVPAVPLVIVGIEA